LNSFVKDLRFFFAMDHSGRILAPFGVSTEAGEAQCSRQPLKACCFVGGGSINA
jgi:hypothetical protein